MMVKPETISIIIPAYNEESRIERALDSIRGQTIEYGQIEILVIDGGSNDRTREIATQYNALVYNNEKTVPEEAKRIGLQNCKGKYVVFMDADEEFISPYQLEMRLLLFQNNPEVKAVIASGSHTPNLLPSLSRYANSFGDPFSYFLYRFDGENIGLCLEKQKYPSKSNSGKIYYASNRRIPIGDSGTTMLDFEYLTEHFKHRFSEPDFVSTKFFEVVNKSGCFGIVEGDIINHYSTVSFCTYLKKLKFRVVNNLFHEDNISGFTARSKLNNELKHRKYLFLVYCALFPIVLIDSVMMAVQKKSLTFMLHFVFVYYVLFQIAFHIFLMAFGKNPVSVIYGE